MTGFVQMGHICGVKIKLIWFDLNNDQFFTDEKMMSLDMCVCVTIVYYALVSPCVAATSQWEGGDGLEGKASGCGGVSRHTPEEVGWTRAIPRWSANVSGTRQTQRGNILYLICRFMFLSSTNWLCKLKFIHLLATTASALSNPFVCVYQSYTIEFFVLMIFTLCVTFHLL